MEIIKMIGKPKTQLSILDGALNARKKRARTETLLTKIDEFVNWKELEDICKGIYKDTRRGRPTLPIIFSLKCLILQYLYNLSDPALEDALIDRLSFQRFLGISFETEIPDFSTIWRFRDRMIKAGLHDTIFKTVGNELDKRELILRRGTLVDATIIQAARKYKKNQDKQQDENGQKIPGTQAQKDHDATSTKKGNKLYYGYKGHIGVDQKSGIIRKKSFTTASVHDSKEMDNMISGDERSLFADKAYFNDEKKREYRKKGIFNGVLDKAKRNHPLSKTQKKKNKQKSKIRNAVERPFAHFKKHMGFRSARYVTLERNDLQFTFLCIIHNIRRGIILKEQLATEKL